MDAAEPDRTHNPYATPAAPLQPAGAAAERPIAGLPRLSGWWVFLLTLCTLGVYVPFWLYRRSRALNRLLPGQPIDSALIHTVLSLYVFNFTLALFEGLGGALAEPALANAGYRFLSQALNLGVIVGLVLWFITLRSRLLVAMRRSGLPDVGMSPVVNFLLALLGWGAVYQQYKINVAIDRLPAPATHRNAQ